MFTARLRLLIEHVGPEWALLSQANPYPVEAGDSVADSHVKLASCLASRSYIALLRACDSVAAANWGTVGKPHVADLPFDKLVANWPQAAIEILALPRFDHNLLEGQIRKEMQRAIEQRKHAAEEAGLRHGNPVVAAAPSSAPVRGLELEQPEFRHGLALVDTVATLRRAGHEDLAEKARARFDSQPRLVANCVLYDSMSDAVTVPPPSSGGLTHFPLNPFQVDYVAAPEDLDILNSLASENCAIARIDLAVGAGNLDRKCVGERIRHLQEAGLVAPPPGKKNQIGITEKGRHFLAQSLTKAPPK